MRSVVERRINFWQRSFRRGLPALTWLVGAVILVVGGSVVAYFGFAVERPLILGAAIALLLLMALGEGAFRLYGDVEHARHAAETKLRAIEDQQPQLSFAYPDVPKHSRFYDLGWHNGSAVQFMGRVVRVPVVNALGAGDATQVHARLTFLDRTPGRAQFAPEHPARGAWDGESTITLPGNGATRYLDAMLLVNGRYPHAYEWTEQSRAAGLIGYAIGARPVTVTIEVMGKGPQGAPCYLERTLEVLCDYPGTITAQLDGGEGSTVRPWELEQLPRSRPSE